MRRKLRSAGLWALAIATIMSTATVGFAQDARYLRIGAGPPGETHFQIAGIVVSAISSPPGALPCRQGEECGVQGLIASAPTTNGSVADVQAVADQRMDAALVQSDVAGWATQGEPPFAGHPLAGLRSISTLASDAIHIVVPRGSAIRSSKDLIGKRVSLGSEGSGSLAHARLLLAAWGLRETQIKARFLHESLAADALTKGELDAFIIVDGLPAPSVAELAKQMPIRLIPIDIAAGTTLRREDPLLHATRIPANTYDGVSEDITTLAVPVSLIVSTHMPDALVYGITKALWQPEAARLLAANQGYLAALPLAAAVGDLGVPLHDGARRYFQERGLFN